MENDLIYVSNGRRLDVLAKTRAVAFEVVGAVEDAGLKLVRIIGATTWYQHNNLLCVDFVGDPVVQKFVRAYLLKHADRLGIEYMINNHEMWRAYAKRHLVDNRGKGYGDFAAGQWSPYGPQPGERQPRFVGTDNPHTDHVHLTLYPGGYQAPPVPVKPTPVPEPKGVKVSLANLKVGASNDDVTQFQRALIRAGQKIPAGATGYYGDQTRKACAAYQTKQGWAGVNADGLPGPTTLARLGLTLTK